MKLALRNRAVRYSALTLAVLALVSSPRTVSAQNTWTGLTDANWSIAGNWSGGSVPISTDNVVFATPVPGTGAAITLGSGSVANSVWIQDDYTFTGGDLALGSGAIRVNLGQAFVLNSQLSGTAGLTKTGGGSLRLTNALNDFTGSILIANGSLVITDPSQLGASTSAIVVTESNTTVGSTTLYGFVGGSLVLDGTAGAITLSRDLLLQGGGPINPRSGAVRSFGDNTISGLVTMAAGTPTARNTRVISNNGTLTLSGGLHVAGTPGTTISTLGGVNTTGAGGNYLLTGPLTGTGTLEKAGAGTLFLNPSATSGFSGRIRVGASVTSGQSSVRISSANVFGTANEEGTNAPIDMRGGILEVRSDNSLNIGKNVYLYESSTFFAGPAVGGEAVSGTVTYGGLHARVSRTATFNSRNGYGMTFSVQTMAASTSTGNSTFNNNMGGLLTVNGNVWDNNDALNRTLAFGGNGNTIIGGSINSGGTGVKTLTKTGSGSLTIMGTETTLNGPVNIQGAIAITDFRSLNNNTGTINLGSTGSTAGALIIGTAQASTGAGLATGKVLNLNGTTATASVYANQAGTNPVMLNSNFTVTGTGAKTLNLGGVNTADNVINGSIMDGGVTGATTTAASFAAGATSISLRSVTGLTVGDAISGTGIAAGTTVTEIDPVTRVVTLSQATSAAGSSNQTINSAALVGPTALTKIGSGTWVLAGANTYTGTTTIANGTLKLKANAATSTVLPSTGAVTFNNSNGFAGATLELVGRDGENNVQQLGLLAYSAGANTLKLTPGTGGTASLAFSRINTTGGSTLNIVGADFTDNTVTLTQVNTGIGSDGIITRSIYWEGADFAYREGGVLRAPVYGEDASTSTTASGSLISGRHNEITGSLSTNTVSVVTLKIAGSHTLSLNSGHTLTLSAGGLLTTGGNALVTGGTLALGSQALVTRVNLETDVLTIESAVTGTGGLTKSGLGTLVLAGVSTRTGTTNINEGTVQLSGSGMLSGNNVTTNIRQNAILDLNGVSTGTSIGQFNNAGVVTNSSAADVVLSIGNGVTTNGTAGTSFGIIEDGAGGGKTSLIIATSNNNSTNTTTYILNGLSTFTGSTTLTKTTVGNLVVQANTLANIGSDSSIGRGDATSDATNAASLVFSGLGGELRYIGGILEGNLTLGSQSASTNRLFTLAGTGATLSSTATNNNAIVWSNTGAIVHSGEAARTVILTGTSTGDNTFNPQLTDSGTGANITSVSKTGAGQWNLGNANNTYTGATTINEGILALNDNGALPTNSSLVLRPTSATSAAIVQMSGVFDRNISDTPTAGIGTITWAGTTASTTGGAGFAAHTTELIVAIGGVASPTALTWGSGGFVGTSSVQNLVLNSTTALSSVDFRNDIDLGNAQRT
ncbi:MAG: autotransporter-associated beta strand repeat-containing protein, partial [Patescibacteria group bacterium]|nr:autotransporter-associated beta strand repeat-containing protein [Patescibacteria group bacterium]